MSETYLDLTHSNFPEQMDKMYGWRDPSASEVPLIAQYQSLIASGQVVTAVEYLNSHPSLMDVIINADKLLRLQHGLTAVQRYFYDNVLDKIYRLGNMKGDWNSQMSSEAGGQNRLNKFDVVRYPVDGVKQYFLVIGEEVPAGTLPTDETVYLQLSMKGDKGDAGIDGVDGAPGLGMSPQGAWVNNKQYHQYDIVSHDGYLWYATEDNALTEPSDDNAVWQRVQISMQVTTSTERPVNLDDGGLWLHMQEDGHVILKTKNENGEYRTVYPEIQAAYVLDAAGENLQRKIYRHYFERDDVTSHYKENDNIYTGEAKLISNPAVTVAKSVMTNTSDTDGRYTEEFTVYDETGVYIVYKTKRVFTENEDGSYDCTPEVIV